jgi:hypothetical protein
MRKVFMSAGAAGLSVALLSSASFAASFALDGSSKPDNDVTNETTTNVTGTGLGTGSSHAAGVGDFDLYIDNAAAATERPNQGTANGTTPVDSNTRVVQGDPAIVNVIGQYAPLGPGNFGIYMASRGASTNNGTNATRNEIEYKLGSGDNAQTLAARFQILHANNASAAGTGGFPGFTGVGDDVPGLGLLQLNSSGGGPAIALTVSDDTLDHYYYNGVQDRPAAAGSFLPGSKKIAPLNSTGGVAAGFASTSQTSANWMDAFLYSDSTGKAELFLYDENLGQIVFHQTYTGLATGPSGNTGNAIFGAELNELPGVSNTRLSVVYDAVRLDAGNTVGIAGGGIVPEPASLGLLGLGGLLGLARRRR